MLEGQPKQKKAVSQIVEKSVGKTADQVAGDLEETEKVPGSKFVTKSAADEKDSLKKMEEFSKINQPSCKILLQTKLEESLEIGSIMDLDTECSPNVDGLDYFPDGGSGPIDLSATDLTQIKILKKNIEIA